MSQIYPQGVYLLVLNKGLRLPYGTRCSCYHGRDMIYILQHGVKGPVKIGYLQNSRVGAYKATLQKGNPVPLYTRGIIRHGGRGTLRELEGFLADVYIDNGWYEPDARIDRLIELADDTSEIDPLEAVAAVMPKFKDL